MIVWTVPLIAAVGAALGAGLILRIRVRQSQWRAPRARRRLHLLTTRPPQLLTMALPTCVPPEAWSRLIGTLARLLSSRPVFRRALVPAELILTRHRREGVVHFAIAVSRALDSAVVTRLVRHHLGDVSVTETCLKGLWEDGMTVGGTALRLVHPAWRPLPTDDAHTAPAANLVIDSLRRTDDIDDVAAVVITISAVPSARWAWLRHQGRRFCDGARTDVVAAVWDQLAERPLPRAERPERALAKACAAKFARRDRAVVATVRVVAAAQFSDQQRRHRLKKRLKSRAKDVGEDLGQVDGSADGGNRLVGTNLGGRAARQLRSVGPGLVLSAAELAAITRPPADPAAAGLPVAPAPVVAPPQGVLGAGD